jgi:hypothetical protein
MPPGDTKPVAGAPQLLEVVPPERPVDLAPEVGNVLIYWSTTLDVPSKPKSQTCSSRRACGSAPPRVTKEELEQRELLGGEVEFGVATPGLPPCRVEAKVADLQQRGVHLPRRRATLASL